MLTICCMSGVVLRVKVVKILVLIVLTCSHYLLEELIF